MINTQARIDYLVEKRHDIEQKNALLKVDSTNTRNTIKQLEEAADLQRTRLRTNEEKMHANQELFNNAGKELKALRAIKK